MSTKNVYFLTLTTPLVLHVQVAQLPMDPCIAISTGLNCISISLHLPLDPLCILVPQDRATREKWDSPSKSPCIASCCSCSHPASLR